MRKRRTKNIPHHPLTQVENLVLSSKVVLYPNLLHKALVNGKLVTNHLILKD
jgi:hypothetical protein